MIKNVYLLRVHSTVLILSIRGIEKVLSVEGYRVVMSAFNFRLGHRIYESSKILCGKYVVKCQAFQYSVLLRLLMYIILLQFLPMNLHYALLRASKLTKEGIEINPGPKNRKWYYATKKV